MGSRLARWFGEGRVQGSLVADKEDQQEGKPNVKTFSNSWVAYRRGSGDRDRHLLRPCGAASHGSGDRFLQSARGELQAAAAGY
jgi:hypothetical protein